MQITRIAQSCHLGNQGRLVLGPHMIPNKHKKFIGKDISRFGIEQIETSNRLSDQRKDIHRGLTEHNTKGALCNSHVELHCTSLY